MTDAMHRRRLACAAFGAGCMIWATGALAQGLWAQFAHDATRNALSAEPGAPLSDVLWTCSKDAQNRTIAFVGQAGVVVSRDRVFAVGSVTVGTGKEWSLYAVDRRSGTIAWSAAIGAPAFSSFSTPLIDDANGAVVVASADQLACFDEQTGVERWRTGLPEVVVNASPTITTTLGLRNRIFITTYDGFGTGGLLVCVNADPRYGLVNPHDPGEIVWTAPIGASSGNTPACAGKTVFVSSVGDWGSSPGVVFAFSADADSEPTPMWSAAAPSGDGFFGPVTVSTDAHGNPVSVYAATYAFSGGTQSSELLRIDAASGSILWSAPCNRSGTAPLVLGDGRIVLCGGVFGYGTVPTVQIFVEDVLGASLVWDSAVDTWIDTNGNGMINSGEFLLLGGWSAQGAAADGGQGALMVGSVPTNPNSFGSSTSLYSVNLNLLPPLHQPSGPSDRSFISGQSAQTGNSGAIAGGNVYSTGDAGLRAFGQKPPCFDIDGNGKIDIDDLYSWEQNLGNRDVDRSGSVNETDRALLLLELRRNELMEATHGRR